MTYDPNQYLQSHRNTWRGFTRLVIYSAASVALTLIVMALFLL
ncbi:MAG TPA: aa3-type cytochrome c oxidase subunit IV [Alphaproteobacteria bacterium]